MKTGTEIGKLIKELREKENKTQEQLSNELNISRSSLSNIERGNQNPSIDILIKISQIFKVSLEYLTLNESEYSYYLKNNENKENKFVVFLKNFFKSKGNTISFVVFVVGFLLLLSLTIFGLVNPITYKNSTSSLWWYFGRFNIPTLLFHTFYNLGILLFITSILYFISYLIKIKKQK